MGVAFPSKGCQSAMNQGSSILAIHQRVELNEALTLVLVWCCGKFWIHCPDCASDLA
jgi:hypothetical protein